MFGEDDRYVTDYLSERNDTGGPDQHKDRRGLVPRAVEYLLKKNSSMDRTTSRELVLQCSFMEVYIDKVRDLLGGL